MNLENLSVQRRALAMVATEAAMAREQDPARYARLERRNAMLASGGLFVPAPLVGHRVADAMWLQQVDGGWWTPDSACSNCLGLAPLDHVILVVALGGREVIQLALLPMFKGEASPVSWDFEAPLILSATEQLELCALGGAALVHLVIDQDGLAGPSAPSPPAGWDGGFMLNTTRSQHRFSLQEGVPTQRRGREMAMGAVEGRLVRLIAIPTIEGCRPAGAGWNCCACGCNNHELRHGCRECKHERCDAVERADVAG